MGFRLLPPTLEGLKGGGEVECGQKLPHHLCGDMGDPGLSLPSELETDSSRQEGGRGGLVDPCVPFPPTHTIRPEGSADFACDGHD